jgi:hypothetical protein
MRTGTNQAADHRLVNTASVEKTLSHWKRCQTWLWGLKISQNQDHCIQDFSMRTATKLVPATLTLLLQTEVRWYHEKDHSDKSATSLTHRRQRAWVEPGTSALSWMELSLVWFSGRVAIWGRSGKVVANTSWWDEAVYFAYVTSLRIKGNQTHYRRRNWDNELQCTATRK